MNEDYDNGHKLGRGSWRTQGIASHNSSEWKESKRESHETENRRWNRDGNWRDRSGSKTIGQAINLAERPSRSDNDTSSYRRPKREGTLPTPTPFVELSFISRQIGPEDEYDDEKRYATASYRTLAQPDEIYSLRNRNIQVMFYDHILTRLNNNKKSIVKGSGELDPILASLSKASHWY
jgi:hypothetical protein